MNKLYVSLVLAGLVAAPSVVMAEDSPHSFSGNVTLTSDYVFRGISQSSGNAAIQGGLDYSHSSGLYLGTWASSVGWIEDFQGYGSGSMEIDVYGGFRGGIGDTGLTYDVGAIQYMYPGTRFNGTTTPTSADTSEIYAGLGWKWFTAKYSYYVSDEVFGFANADGSDYLDISASFPIGDTGLTIGAHWGTFSFKNNAAQDYDDWKISATYDMGKLGGLGSGVTVGVAYTDTDADATVWSNSAANGGDFLGDDTVIVWVSKAL